MPIDDNDYKRLIHPIEGQMIRSIARILPNTMDADDALQEALETIWKRFQKVKKHPNPAALMLRIAMNAAYNTLRGKVRRKQIECVSIEIDMQDSHPSIAERISRDEQKTAIYQAIRLLSRKQAQAVLMRFIQELPFPDIAQALGCSEATARTHVKRGCANLRKSLSGRMQHNAQEILL